MFKITHIYIELDSSSPKKTEKRYGYVMGVEGSSKTRESFGKIKDSYHSATLKIIVEALKRYRVPSEINIHIQDDYIKNAYEHYLGRWQQNDFKNAKGSPVANCEEWREIRELSQKHLIFIETGKNEFSNWISREIVRRVI